MVKQINWSCQKRWLSFALVCSKLSLLQPNTICFLWPCKLPAGHSKVFTGKGGLDVHLRVRTCGFHGSDTQAAYVLCGEAAAACVVSEADGWHWWWVALRESTSKCCSPKNSSGRVVLLSPTGPTPEGPSQLSQHLSGLHAPHHTGSDACGYPLKGPRDPRLPVDYVPPLSGGGEGGEMFSIHCGDTPGEPHGNKDFSDLLNPTGEGLHVPNASWAIPCEADFLILNSLFATQRWRRMAASSQMTVSAHSGLSDPLEVDCIFRPTKGVSSPRIRLTVSLPPLAVLPDYSMTLSYESPLFSQTQTLHRAGSCSSAPMLRIYCGKVSLACGDSFSACDLSDFCWPSYVEHLCATASSSMD